MFEKSRFAVEFEQPESTVDAPTRPIADHRAYYTFATPTSVSNPSWLHFNEELASGFSLEATPELLNILSGNTQKGATHIAHGYAGHQFGNWAGQLGDGRAMELGERVNEDGKCHVFQLKGAGRTTYSRMGDGRAVLRSSLREYICAEAMYHLGVPTTRSLALIATGDLVVRDMFYDGRPEEEPGAIVCRVAESFLRFGHFELFAHRGQLDELRQLAAFSIQTYWPELELHHRSQLDDAIIGQWFMDICRKTASMVADWMRFGFVHGVMNTDNMSIHGLTIDYGPYGWLSNYDPTFTPNTTDNRNRRYRYAHQPTVAMWNLQRFAEALSPIVTDMECLKAGLQHYQNYFNSLTVEHTMAKLGLSHLNPTDEVFSICSGVVGLMEESKSDWTVFFRQLSELDVERTSGELFPHFVQHVKQTSYQKDISDSTFESWHEWFLTYHGTMMQKGFDTDRRVLAMNTVNPKYIFRNAWAHEVIDKAASGDMSEAAELIEVLKKPFDEQPEWEYYAQMAPDWSFDTPGVSSLSCSS